MSTTKNGNLVIQVAKLEERMETVEEGVANFKAFQKLMTDFVTRNEERAKHRTEREQEEKAERDKKDTTRARIHFALLGGVISLIVGLMLAAVNWATNFEKRHHVSDNTVITSEQPKQHATKE